MGETNDAVEFKAFDKIARLNREVVVTEKIDGTNGVVFVPEGSGPLLAGSRSRWITPKEDNFGFARWVLEHEEELRVGLGPGYHYGEWWGAKIQRGYGLTEKRWSLFNEHRWGDDFLRPKCCHVVPVLGRGISMQNEVALALDALKTRGSFAAPGFMKPEGVVAFHTAALTLFKVTLEKDEEPKAVAERRKLEAQ